jgi:hypothetical protein
MPATKTKKTTTAKREPNLEVWSKKEFKQLLDPDTAELTSDGLKVVIQNQRGINGKLYKAILGVIDALEKLGPRTKSVSDPLMQAKALAASVPGDGPPGCPDKT